TPLHLAASDGHADVVQFLVEHRAEINCRENDGWTPLHFAANNRHTQIFRFLAERHVNVNPPDKKGLTPLHIMARGGHADIVQFLIEHGADVNCRDIFFVEFAHPVSDGLRTVENDGCIPLHFAATNGHTQIVRFLVESGAD
ncbi:ankyrin repeat protein, partial [Mycena olivaceomarginata]